MEHRNDTSDDEDDEKLIEHKYSMREREVFMKDPTESIEDIFKCPICLGRVRDAQMCPTCSKMCCAQCIEVSSIKMCEKRKPAQHKISP
jgi:hypothetical protein